MEKKEYISLFNKYVKQFDLKNKKMMDKFHHTYRVCEYAKDISVSLGMKDEDVVLAYVCALFHDIGRFIQLKQYDTYSDLVSIDHGDVGYDVAKEILSDIVDDKEILDIILLSIKNHNKLKVQEGLTDRQLIFSNIIRDADKLDIMMEQANSINDDIYDIKNEIIESINMEVLVPNSIVKTHIDEVFRVLSFIFDINYNYSFNFIKEKILTNKFNLLKANIERDNIEKIEEDLKKYIDRKMIEC